MKKRFLWLTLFCGIVTLGVAHAQPGKSGDKKSSAPKSAGDLAFDEYEKVRLDRTAKPDQARFQKVIASGLGFLAQYPTHGRASEVVRTLGGFGGSLAEKNQAALRLAYSSQLKYELVNARYKEGVTDDAKLAFAALDASVADFETREMFTKPNLETLREKIDALAAMPGNTRFLVPAEHSYFDILNRTSPPKAEAHLRSLLEHPDAAIVTMAQQELNLFEVRKAPYELKFTGLDGKECDFAQLRGKVVALYFWSATSDSSVRSFESLKLLHDDYKKRGFDIVTVALDEEDSRERVAKIIKDNKLAWPVYFDGKGAKNDFAPKLNISRAPAVALFDQKGLLVANNVRPNQLEGEVRRLLGMGPKAAEPQEMPAASSSKRRR